MGSPWDTMGLGEAAGGVPSQSQGGSWGTNPCAHLWVAPVPQHRDRHSPGTQCRPQDTGLSPHCSQGIPALFCHFLSFFFSKAGLQPHPQCCSWRKGCGLAQQKPQRGWSQTHTQEHLLGREPALRALTLYQRSLGASPALSALFRAQSGALEAFPSSTAGWSFPRGSQPLWSHL